MEDMEAVGLKNELSEKGTLLGRPLTFGDTAQIKAVKLIAKNDDYKIGKKYFTVSGSVTFDCTQTVLAKDEEEALELASDDIRDEIMDDIYFKVEQKEV